MTADERLAQAAQDRDELIAQLAGVKPVKSRWQVYRQSSRGIEYPTCTHRWAWRAERCARLKTRDDVELAVRYVARRVEA